VERTTVPISWVILPPLTILTIMWDDVLHNSDYNVARIRRQGVACAYGAELRPGWGADEESGWNESGWAEANRSYPDSPWGTRQLSAGWAIQTSALTTAIHRARELGFNLFDTAQAYSFGASERLLGRDPARRVAAQPREVVIATKGGVPPESPRGDLY
jgi:hypothetical protein